MNFETARLTMVNRQIRPWDVSDRRVLDVLFTVPREAFVPPEYRELAYADIVIPLAEGQEMTSSPVAARILQAVNPTSTDRVLEIGTGSGYLTALLAMLAKEVVSVEISPLLHGRARAVLAGQGIRNVRLMLGDAAAGWDQTGSFDGIVITGSVVALQERFQHQLRGNGRLFAVVGSEPVMEARLITRTGPHGWREESLFETILPPLRESAPPAERFVP